MYGLKASSTCGIGHDIAKGRDGRENNQGLLPKGGVGVVMCGSVKLDASCFLSVKYDDYNFVQLCRFDTVSRISDWKFYVYESPVLSVSGVIAFLPLTLPLFTDHSTFSSTRQK